MAMIFVLVINDHLTRWTIAIPMPNHQAPTVAQAVFSYVICQFGVPNVIVTDQGPEFMSKLMVELYQRFGITKINTSAYHPQGNGITERRNKDIVTCLSMYMESKFHHKDWDCHLDAVSFILNTTPHSTTGYTPYRLMMGREAHLPFHSLLEVDSADSSDLRYRSLYDMINDITYDLSVAIPIAKQHLQAAGQAWENLTAKYKNIANYEVGSLVWIWNPAIKKDLTKKFSSPWFGHYRVVERVNTTNYKVELVKEGPLKARESFVVHCTRMKPVVIRDKLFVRDQQENYLSGDASLYKEFEQEIKQAEKEEKEQEQEQEDLRDPTSMMSTSGGVQYRPPTSVPPPATYVPPTATTSHDPITKSTKEPVIIRAKDPRTATPTRHSTRVPSVHNTEYDPYVRT